MANYKRIARKLQTALANAGRIIKINTLQFYSEEQNRMIDSYILLEKRPYRRKDGTAGMKNFELLKTCSMPEVVKFLAELYKGGG